MAVSDDGRTLVSGAADGIVKIWDLRTNLVVQNFKGHRDKVDHYHLPFVGLRGHKKPTLPPFLPSSLRCLRSRSGATRSSSSAEATTAP